MTFFICLKFSRNWSLDEKHHLRKTFFIYITFRVCHNETNKNKEGTSFFTCKTGKEKGRGVGINEDFMAKKYFPFGINILFDAALFFTVFTLSFFRIADQIYFRNKNRIHYRINFYERSREKKIIFTKILFSNICSL